MKRVISERFSVVSFRRREDREKDNAEPQRTRRFRREEYFGRHADLVEPRVGKGGARRGFLV